MTPEGIVERAGVGARAHAGERRKAYRIAPEFQNRFRTMVMAFALVITVLCALLSWSVAYALRHPGSLLDTAWVPLGLAGLAVAAAVAIVYLCDRLSHRYCGPVLRMVQTLEAVRRRERPAPIQLRKYDEFQDLAEALNAALIELDAMQPPAG